MRLLLPVLALGLALAGCAGTPVTSGAATGTASASVSPSPRPSVAFDAALRDELLAMLAEDQAVRTGVAPPGDDRTAEELFDAWPDVDAANTRRIREILDELGAWPGISLVGDDGSTAAWALVQHADLQPDLQEQGLALLEAAVAAGDASPGDLAYLTDRVLVAQGEPQVYGTQWGTNAAGEWEPRTPIEDEANVDARRAEAGLGTLADYLEELKALPE